MNDYKEFLGPSPGDQIKPFSPELQKATRDLNRLSEADYAWVDLYIQHDTMLPSEITARLDILPNEATRDDPMLAFGYESKVRTFWQLSSEGKVSTNRLEDHLRWLLNQLFGKLPAIRSLQNDSVKFTICGHMRPWSRLVDPCFEVDVIQALAQLRMPLQLVIDYENSESEY